MAEASSGKSTGIESSHESTIMLSHKLDSLPRQTTYPWTQQSSIEVPVDETLPGGTHRVRCRCRHRRGRCCGGDSPCVLLGEREEERCEYEFEENQRRWW